MQFYISHYTICFDIIVLYLLYLVFRNFVYKAFEQALSMERKLFA